MVDRASSIWSSSSGDSASEHLPLPPAGEPSSAPQIPAEQRRRLASWAASDSAAAANAEDSSCCSLVGLVCDDEAMLPTASPPLTCRQAQQEEQPAAMNQGALQHDEWLTVQLQRALASALTAQVGMYSPPQQVSSKQAALTIQTS